jgi:hypothetical protein
MNFLGNLSVQGVLTGAFMLAAGKTYDCGSPGMCTALTCCAILALCVMFLTYLGSAAKSE